LEVFGGCAPSASHRVPTPTMLIQYPQPAQVRLQGRVR
jgi:hypothetical protein